MESLESQYNSSLVRRKNFFRCNMSLMPVVHRNDVTKKQFPHDIKYAPPDDIGSCFYPKRGPYASADPDLIRSHFKELSDYAIIVSWWGTPRLDCSHPVASDAASYRSRQD